MASNRSPNGRIAAFDGLRALAALGVVCLHSVQLATPLLTASGPDQIAIRAAMSGWIGVDLFFVLSGYLITGILLDTRGTRGYFRSFYARRTLRIFPLYYGTLALLLVFVPLFLPALIAHSAHATGGQFWEWVYLSNWHIAWAGTWEAVPTHTGHFWSLAVEEQFYLCWPLVVWWLGPRGTRKLSIWLLAGAPLLRAALLWHGVSPVAVFVSTPTRIDGLAAGALLACIIRTPKGPSAVRSIARRAGGVALFAVLLMIVRTGYLEQNDPLMQVAGYSALAVGFAAVVALADTQRWLSHPWLTYLGRRSYAIYVLHPAIIGLLDRAHVGRRLPLVAGSGLLRQAVFFCVAVGATVIAAEISWRLWESPWLALKRYVPRPATAAPRG